MATKGKASGRLAARKSEHLVFVDALREVLGLRPIVGEAFVRQKESHVGHWSRQKGGVDLATFGGRWNRVVPPTWS
jgi:hypothetical protein